MWATGLDVTEGVTYITALADIAAVDFNQVCSGEVCSGVQGFFWGGGARRALRSPASRTQRLLRSTGAQRGLFRAGG